jgi:hypothetical protein
MVWLKILFSSPLQILNGLIALLCFALSADYFYKLRLLKKGDNHDSIKKGINNILLICFFMIFFISIDQFLSMKRAFSSISSSGIGDLRVIAYGLFQFETVLVFNYASISFFLIVWYVLRAYSLVKKGLSEKN